MDEDKAMDFMYALNGTRYGKFVAEILNEVTKKAIAQPKWLNEIYVVTNPREIVSKGRGSYSGTSFATIEQHSRRTSIASSKEGRKEGRKKTNQSNANFPKGGASEATVVQEESTAENKAAKKGVLRKARKTEKITNQIVD